MILPILWQCRVSTVRSITCILFFETLSEERSEKMKKEPTTIYERGSWYYRYQVLNKNLEKKYRKEGGFKTQEEAKQAFISYQKEIQKKKARPDA